MIFLPYVIIDGISYHYSAEAPSSGDPEQAVLFIHGAGGSHARWSYQISHLGRRFLAMAVDLPGHGLSGGAASDSIATYSEFIMSFSERLLGSPFFLAGHSMGGAVALDFALNYPERLAGLVLMGTGAKLRVLPAILESFAGGKKPEGMSGFMYRPGTPGAVLKAAEEEMEGISPKVYYSDFLACDRFDSSSRLGEIDVPALVMTGDQDALTPPKYGKFLAGGIKNATFEIIEDAGHILMLEQPGAVNSALERFIEKTAGGLPEGAGR
ncbi:MAG: alpha/beta fold hydrolase [Desulfocucumaceae bacterium]